VWRLGKAYWIARNGSYVRAFERKTVGPENAFQDQKERERFSVLDLSIRSINMVTGFMFFSDSPALGPSFWLSYSAVLFGQVRSLRRIFGSGRVPVVHRFAAGVAVLIAGVYFSNVGQGRRWVEDAYRSLVRDCAKSIGPTGEIRECGYPEQLFVAEALTMVLAAGSRSWFDVPGEIGKALRRMYGFLGESAHADGTFPLPGSPDDSRIIPDPIATQGPYVPSFLHAASVLTDIPPRFEPWGTFNQVSLWLLGAEGFETYRRSASSARF
jgi:hypothetical protein